MYIPIPATQVTGSFGVVNYIDPITGILSTYLVIRNTSMRAETYNSGDSSDVTVPFPRGLIGALTSSLATALSSSTSGTF